MRISVASLNKQIINQAFTSFRNHQISQKHYFKLLQSKAMNFKNGNKVTFKSQQSVFLLVSDFLKMKKSIYLLINCQPDIIFNQKEILSICRNFPKSLERNKYRYNQALLSQQVNKTLQIFLKAKEKRTVHQKKQKSIEKNMQKSCKSYQFYLLFVQFMEILKQRIINGLNSHLDVQSQTKMFTLIRQIDFLTNQVESWAKGHQRKTHRSRNASIQYVYPQNNSQRKTLVTTTDASKNISKYEKNQITEDVSRRIRDSCLLRAGTAKLQRKQLKLSKRSPSAAAILKNQSFKQPVFQPKRSVIKYKHKSTDFQDKTNRNNYEFKDQNFNFQSTHNSRFKQRKLTINKQRNISILNKSIKDDEENGFKNTKILNHDSQKLKKIGVKILGKKGKEKKHVIMSNEEITVSKKDENSSESLISYCNIADPEQIKQGKLIKNEDINNKENNISSQKNISKLSDDSSLDVDSSTIFIKQRKVYKKGRRSGRVITKNSDEFMNMCKQNAKASSKGVSSFSRRRKAILSTHNDELAQIQKVVDEEKRLRTKRELQYNQNVFLAVSDAFKSKNGAKQNKEYLTYTRQKQSFNSLFGQINTFLKDFSCGKSTDVESVFFEQQKRIKSLQQIQLRQKMKQMSRKNNNSTNIFDIASSQVNYKDQVYNKIHRLITFNSDTQWIRNMYSPKQPLIQR